MSDPSTRSISLDGNGLRSERDLLNSRIIALFLESAIWGVFLVTYLLGTWNLVGGRQPSSLNKRNRFLLIMNSLMFILSTVHLALTVRMTLFGFVSNRQDAQTIYQALFDTSFFGSAIGVAQFYIYATQTLIGDGFMLHHLFVVWNRRRDVLIFPIILLIIDAVSGYASYAVSILTPVFFTFSFFTNIFCSILIIIRVLKSSDAHKQSHMTWKSRAWFSGVTYPLVIEAVVQSAVVYSAASIAFVVTFFVSPNVGYIACLAIFSPLIGLVFSLTVYQISRRSLVERTMIRAGAKEQPKSEPGSPSELSSSPNAKARAGFLTSHVPNDSLFEHKATPHWAASSTRNAETSPEVV